LPDEGYAATFKELLDDTPWEKYGNSSNPKCAQCMAHCGYEATAVEDMLQHPIKALITSLRGPKTTGPMVAEPTPKWAKEALKPRKTIGGIPVKIERYRRLAVRHLSLLQHLHLELSHSHGTAVGLVLELIAA
jgi:hypothetical protein